MTKLTPSPFVRIPLHRLIVPRRRPKSIFKTRSLTTYHYDGLSVETTVNSTDSEDPVPGNAPADPSPHTDDKLFAPAPATNQDTQYNQITRVTKDAAGRELQTIRYVTDSSGTYQHRVRNIYDAKGRIVQIQRHYPKIGFLLSEVQEYSPHTQRHFSYPNTTGRLNLEWAGVDGKWFYNIYNHDDFGRFASKGHYWKPEGDTNYAQASDWHLYFISNFYNSKGFLTSIHGWDTNPAPGNPANISPMKLWWQINPNHQQSTGYDAHNRVDAFTLGDGSKTRYFYNPYNGTRESEHISKHDDTLLREAGQRFDRLGRIDARWEKDAGGVLRKESFAYDALNRVTHTRRFIDGDSLGVSEEVGRYDVYGNLLAHAGDQGANLTFGSSTTPTRLTNAFGGGVSYNGNGHISWRLHKSGVWMQYQWNRAGKIHRARMHNNSVDTTFAYDAADNLVTEHTKRHDKDFSKRLQIIGFEQNYSNSSSTGTTWQLDNTRILIDTPTGLAGSFTWSPDNTGTRRYFHHDYLGSLCLVTNEAGDIETRFSYAPFGNARDPLTWQHLDEPIADHASSAANLGYGGHRMFSTFGLVHMGGRVYDPTLGRFLSPDPVVQLPHHTQNHNRYSYVLNNPLSLTDPTGNFIQFIPAILWYAGVITSTTTMIVATMVVTFASVLIAGGSVGQAFKAAMIAGAAAVVTSAIGSYFDSLYPTTATGLDFGIEFARAAAHGISGGGFSELGGGDFKSGFAAGFASSALGSSMKTGKLGSYLSNNQGARVVASALVGGTTSRLSGGKFSNGALTGALNQILNDEHGVRNAGEGDEYDGILDDAGKAKHLVLVDMSAEIPDDPNFEAFKSYGKQFNRFTDEGNYVDIRSYKTTAEFDSIIGAYENLDSIHVVAHGIFSGDKFTGKYHFAGNSLSSSRIWKKVIALRPKSMAKVHGCGMTPKHRKVFPNEIWFGSRALRIGTPGDEVVGIKTWIE